MKGEAIAILLRHVLVKTSDMVAVCYEKGGLGRGVRVGERVMTQYGDEKSQMYEQDKEPAWENTRGVDWNMGW